jgi:hypothetical protein
MIDNGLVLRPNADVTGGFSPEKIRREGENGEAQVSGIIAL